MWYCSSFTNAKEKQNTSEFTTVKTDDGKNIIVLELFTSQGCSSCPPADKLLGTYTTQKNIIPLSFHVDYWDRLGWKDAFSSHDFSKRQYKYAASLKSKIFTPQIVINGETQLIGSESQKISSVINKLLQQQSAARIEIQKPEVTGEKIKIRFKVSGRIANSSLNIAFIEMKTVTVIGAGENHGATLTGYNVVRDFNTIDIIKEGQNSLTLNIPSSLQKGNRQLVLFLQQKKYNKIIAAGKTEF